MAGIFNGPPRGGTRGGRSEFSWEDVKSKSNEREYYLGHSVKALTGRWQNNKDVYWYTRGKDGADGQDPEAARQNEMAMVKQREQDLMMEALGLKPKAPKHTIQQPRLGKEDMQKLLGRDEDEDDGPAGADGDRVKGLGFNASRTTGAIQSGVDQERLDGMGLRGGPSGAAPHDGGGPTAPTTTGYRTHAATAAGAPQLHGASRGRETSRSGTRKDEIADLSRRRKKEGKKASKRAKKDEKREKKKSKKRDDRSRSRSRSPRRERKRNKSASDDDSGSEEGNRNAERGGYRNQRSRSRSLEREGGRHRRHASNRSRSRSRERTRDARERDNGERRRRTSPGDSRKR